MVTKKRRSSFKIEWKWLIATVALAIVLITAVFLNINTENHNTEKFTSSIAVDNSDLKINWNRYQALDIELTESVNISESGTYHLTGILENGQVSIDAGVGEVRLILDNATIKNSDGPAIVCYNAENLLIELMGENHLEDGSSYASSYDADVSGVVYSKADLAFAGEGGLEIVANFADGIVGKDDVAIRGGDYIIKTTDDGIRGKDSVYIENGNLTLDTVGDAIKSTNDTDIGKGFILVDDGELYINARSKGLQAVNNIIIKRGNLKIETVDDAVHSDNSVGFVNGDLVIDSGDDGIHADRELIIDGGSINIAQSHEGLEAQTVTINGGEISIVALDDGINAGGGADNSAINRIGANDFKTDENCSIVINGGEIYVNSSGDGIDSNGYLTFKGGDVVVDGPVNNGNGALDSGLGITIQGGSVIAIGSSGMAENLGANSGVCNISVFFFSQQPAGTVIELRNSKGEAVLSHVSAKAFSHLAAGSEALTLGETYTLYVGDTAYQTFTVSEVTTTLGNSRTNQNTPPGGGQRR